MTDGPDTAVQDSEVSHPKSRWLSLVVLPALFALGGCATTIFLDKVEAAAVGQPPAPPSTGTSTSANPVIAENPLDPASSDRWLRFSRTNPTSPGDSYIGTFTQNVTQKKAGVDLVGFIPQSSKIMMTVFFETGQPPFIPLLHVDLLPNGKIRVNDTQEVGTFKFDHLVGFFLAFDLAAPAPSANILIRGGANDASVTVPIPSNAASRGIGRVRIFAPFEGPNAPNGSFLVNEILATIPN